MEEIHLRTPQTRNAASDDDHGRREMERKKGNATAATVAFNVVGDRRHVSVDSRCEHEGYMPLRVMPRVFFDAKQDLVISVQVDHPNHRTDVVGVNAGAPHPELLDSFDRFEGNPPPEERSLKRYRLCIDVDRPAAIHEYDQARNREDQGNPRHDQASELPAHQSADEPTGGGKQQPHGQEPDPRDTDCA